MADEKTAGNTSPEESLQQAMEHAPAINEQHVLIPAYPVATSKCPQGPGVNGGPDDEQPFLFSDTALRHAVPDLVSGTG
jgi:hypothetical protein